MCLTKFVKNPSSILELYNVLAQLSLMTSTMEVNMQYNKFGIRVAKGLMIQDLKKLGNIKRSQT